MTIQVELPGDIAHGLQLLSEKDLMFYRQGVLNYAKEEAEKLVRMTPDERTEYEETCAAILESQSQYKQGKFLTLEEAKERSRQEIEAERHCYRPSI